MPILTTTEARKNLFRLVEETLSSHEPVTITGKKGNAILISEEDWTAIQETLYLLNIPDMRESIIKGLQTPLSDCDENLEW